MESSSQTITRDLSPEARVFSVIAALDRIDHGYGTDQDYAIRSQWNATVEKLNYLTSVRGKRYAGCTFDNYECTNPKQSEVVQKLKEYAVNGRRNVTEGKNVILYGTKGTGKDHLLMALAKSVRLEIGVTASWINGIDLHAKLREATYGKTSIELTEAKTPILWISDLLPPKGVLTDSQQNLLFALIDERYSKQLPTWISMNVVDGKEAEERLGSQLMDRLKQNVLAIPFDWPSYRTEERPA